LLLLAPSRAGGPASAAILLKQKLRLLCFDLMRSAAIIAAVLAGLCAGCHIGRTSKATIPVSEAVGLHDERAERICQ
jgi:hypothetical protein